MDILICHTKVWSTYFEKLLDYILENISKSLNTSTELKSDQPKSHNFCSTAGIKTISF